MFTFAVIVALFLIACTFSDAFMMPGSRWMQTSSQTKNLNRLSMADVELTFPNGKKAKVPAGSAMKDAAKKAGFSPNYGCEEGTISPVVAIVACHTY